MWKKIKNYFANRAIHLQKKQDDEKMRFQNLQQSRSIVLLASCQNEHAFKELEKCEKTLLNFKNNIKIKTLIFKNKTFEKNTSFDFGNRTVISNKELDWRGLPKKEILEDLTNNSFDLLFDLSEKSSEAHYYLVHSINPTMSVGRFSEKNKAHFDFMIQFEKPWNMPEFLNQAIHFLTQINQNKAA